MFVEKIGAKIRNFFVARNAMRDLERLSNEELRDIGILRSEIYDAAHGKLRH